MSTPTVKPPFQPLDPIGSEVYTSHYTVRRTLLFALTASGLFNLSLLVVVGSLATRPVVTRYVKIDELGRATPLKYSDLTFTPTEGVIVQQLTEWAKRRYTLLQASVAKDYPENYFFLSDQLASQLMSTDRANRTVAKISTGEVEPNDLKINNIQILSLSKELVHGKAVHKGSALIDLTKTFSPATSAHPRTEHWTVAVTYYLDPDEVSKKAALLPAYEFANPLGLVITDFHESQAIR